MTDLVKEARAYADAKDAGRGHDGEGARLLRALASRLEALEAAQRWRPIEEAPKDGTRITAYGPHCVEITQWWTSGGGPGWLCDAGLNQHDHWNYVETADVYTHWMPLPPPPKDETP